MPLTSIRRLALSDLDEVTLRRLVEHGEDLLVERKREPPKGSGFGAEVASFANTLGGWLLLGIANDRSVTGYTPQPQLDLQSHLGQLLRAQVDPLPPFVAAVRPLDGQDVGVIRVFESADTPHIVRETGAVYVRDSAGKQPVKDQRLLLELARRGEEALKQAHERLRTLGVIQDAVNPPHTLEIQEVSALVRAGPVTVTPQFTDWALSSSAAEWCRQQASAMAESLGIKNAEAILEPRGRGVFAHWRGGFQLPVDGAFAIDAGGVVAARLARGIANNRYDPSVLRGRLLDPMIRVIGDTLASCEAYGRSVWDMIIRRPAAADLAGAPRRPPLEVYASSELTVPADPDD